uniref:Uncharacterized protein n=1 Tax=Arundo donax TaxID=35708 RepID=A0A0A9GNF4_ARUDO
MFQVLTIAQIHEAVSPKFGIRHFSGVLDC